MLVNATVALEILRCIRESDGSGHSEPFIWPALLAISPSGNVSITAPAVENARLVIKKDMRAGDVADIPTSVGAIGMQVDDASPGLILAVTLLEADDGPDHAIKAAFQAYVSGLRDAIQSHLLELNNPATRDAAVAATEQEVQDDVMTAFVGNLSFLEKIRIFVLGIVNPDDVIDSDFQSFSAPFVPTQFTLRFGPDRGGRLLSYGDAGTPGNVSSPVIVGFGGWSVFKFLFAGKNAAGEDRIYAVDQDGQLLSYGDAGTPGNVSSPVIVGFGGWSDFKFLVAGRNAAGENRIYSVDKFVQSQNDFEIEGNLQVSPIIIERDEVTTAA